MKVKLSSALWSWMDVQLCSLHWYHSTYKWTEHHLTRKNSFYQWNVWQHYSIWEGASTVETVTTTKQCTHFPVLRRENPINAKNIQQKFNFFNKNSTPIFKACASMEPQSTYFRCHFTLMFQLFQLNFNWRWQIFSMTRPEKYMSTCSAPWLYILYLMLRDHAWRITVIFRNMFINISTKKYKRSWVIQKSSQQWKIVRGPQNCYLLHMYTQSKFCIREPMASFSLTSFHPSS